jgi:DNA-binding transcriptional LysR family regulator
MNAEDLRIFVAVRQAASIKGAARALKVDHSTVSRRLAALEESLGVRLFDRTPEGLVATEAADAVSPLADQINLLLHEVQNAARAASDVPSGPVRIAVSPVVAEHFLMPRVAELQQQFPGIELDIRAGLARARFVGEREADIAIRQHPIGTKPAEPSVLAAKVGRIGFALFASREYVQRHGRPARPITSLEGHSLIGTTSWGPGASWFDELENAGDETISAFPYSTACAAVLAGLGISVLPCLGADSDPRLTRVSDVMASFDLWVVSSAQSRKNTRIRMVKEALIELLRQARDELAGERQTKP